MVKRNDEQLNRVEISQAVVQYAGFYTAEPCQIVKYTVPMLQLCSKCCQFRFSVHTVASDYFYVVKMQVAVEVERVKGC